MKQHWILLYLLPGCKLNPIANPNPSPLLGRLHNCRSVDGYQWRCGRLLSPTAEPSCSGLFTDHASSYTAYFEVTELLIVTDLSSQSHSLFRWKVLCSFPPRRTKRFPTAVLGLYFLCSKKHFSAALVFTFIPSIGKSWSLFLLSSYRKCAVFVIVVKADCYCFAITLRAMRYWHFQGFCVSCSIWDITGRKW